MQEACLSVWHSKSGFFYVAKYKLIFCTVGINFKSHRDQVIPLSFGEWSLRKNNFQCSQLFVCFIIKDSSFSSSSSSFLLFIFRNNRIIIILVLQWQKFRGGEVSEGQWYTMPYLVEFRNFVFLMFYRCNLSHLQILPKQLTTPDIDTTLWVF